MTRPKITARSFAILLSGTAALALASPALAQSTTWDGDNDSDFGNGPNWDTNSVPGPTDNVIIERVPNQPIIDNRTFTINDLTLRDATQFIIRNGGNLTGAGNAVLGTGSTVTVTGANSAWLVGGSSTVGGTVNVREGGSFLGARLTVEGSGRIVVDGVNSTWRSTGAATINGAIEVRAGGHFTGLNNQANILNSSWSLGSGGSIIVDGAGSRFSLENAFSSAGTITVQNGGTAAFERIVGSGSASVRVNGQGSALTVGGGPFLMGQGDGATGGFLLVENGGQLTSNGFGFASNGVPATFDVMVQGAGSRWTINPGNSRALGAGTNAVSFRVLDGGVVDDVTPSGNWSLGQGTSVLVSGAGSRWLTSGVVNFNATTVGQPVGDVIIENGGEFTVRANGLSTLGSIGGPVSRSLIVRSGGQVNFTGGTGAGLSVRGGTILVDGGTLTGRLDLGLGTAGRTTVTVQNGGLIDGTGGGNWFTDAGADFIVTGANSRLIAVGAPTVGGDITVSAGGNASFQAIDFANAARTNLLTISGVNSQFATGDFFVSRFGGQSSTILVENGGRLVTGRALLGNNSGSSTVNLTVTGAGSLWQVTSGATALDFGAGASDVNIAILNGGRFQSLSGINPSFRPNTDLLVSGAGSLFETAGNISFGGASAGEPVGTLVIENGASLITRGPSDNGLGFNGVLRTMAITNGSSWIMTGGLNSGLQIETTRLVVDNSTLSAEGGISIGLRFTGTDLILRNADFSARSLNLGSVAGNRVTIGTRADGSAGAAGTFNVGSVGLTNGNTLDINHTGTDFLIASAITGAGAINHLAGRTRLTGASAGYSGLLTVSGGDIVIDGTLGGNAARATFENARLSGTGTFGGDVTLGNATLAPGNSAGTFRIGGDLVLSAGSVLDFELGLPDQAPGAGSDLIIVGGDLTLDGTLNISNIGGFGSGLYRLINYGGTLTDNGLAFGGVPDGFELTGLTLDLATAGQVNLLAQAATPDFDFIFWDGGNTAADGLINGGSGTWTVDTTNWTTLEANNNGVFDPADFLIFRAPEVPESAATLTRFAAIPSAATGTVTVDNTAGQVSLANGVQFAATGYTVTGGAIRLDAPGAIIRVGDGSAEGSAFVATIASALTGGGSLTKTDLGTLILLGANTYTGGTTVAGGRLQGDTTSLRGAIAIDAPGTLLFNQTSNGTFSGILSGAGRIDKDGAGVLDLGGTHSDFVGLFNLMAGGLNLTGTLGRDVGSSRLATAAGTTLTGTGTVGNLAIGGSFAPGAGTAPAAATFNVAGDLSFAAGSRYLVDLAANGSGDRVVAGGDVVLAGGTVEVNLLSPELDYVDGSIFTIVEAEGSLTGTFAGLVETSAFLDFALGYDSSRAFLTLSVLRQFPDVALTFNQRQAASGLMELDRSTGSDSLAVYNAILLLDAEDARAAFDLASGEIYADVLASAQRSAMLASAANRRRSAAPGKPGWDAWAEGTLRSGRVSADGNGARFTQDQTRLSLGLDYHGEDDSWAAGIGGGWISNDIDNADRLSHAELDGWHIDGFARYGDLGKGLTAFVAASHASADGTAARAIRFGSIDRATSAAIATRTTALSADLRFGMGGDSWAFGPAAGIEYSRTRLSAFAEAGAGALDLSSDGARDGWTRATLGGFVSHRSDSARLLVDLRYLTGKRDDSAVAMTLAGSPQAFTILPARGSKHGFVASASGEVDLGGGWSLGGSLDALIAGDERAVSASAAIKLAF
ncbi:autotransporter-associated beta strand repeat-containing protein [Erythrobacter donghaensis]|uniref:autotransporter-associated beta strand repeat-containing protein n=1 Tax=Erythrobacter donghaensis TaxID=267135 RepID=UPI00130212B8|nr:autotransporter-associated beta strand repeat-containing protein [Erythrobacter donghaensis]